MLIGFFAKAQNLVPNPSFEEYTQCPNDISDFQGFVSNWFIANFSSSDYFNACGESPASVPSNHLGFQPARTGVAYVGIHTYSDGGYREYIEVELLEPLETDPVYCVAFFVARGNLHVTSTSSIGAHLSQAMVSNTTTSEELGLVPQVANPASNLITDTLNWTEISGPYVAIGGEKFITIGNFYDNAATPVTGNTEIYNLAYYYIDDITVSKCSTFGTSVKGLVEDERQLLSVYPNPASDVVELSFEFKPGFQYNVGIYDLSGRLVLREAVSINSRKIDVSGLNAGFYTVRIDGKNGLVEAAKLAVVR